MARTSRIKKTGMGTSYYHLISRTNDRRFLFERGRVKTQLYGPERKVRINPEHRLNQTAVFDLRGALRGDEVVTMGVFGL